MKHPEALLTTEQLARRLYVGAKMVREMERTGRIPSIRMGPSTVRYDYEEVVAALRKKDPEPAP